MRVSIDYTDKGYKRKIIIHNTDLWDGPENLAAIIYPFLKKYKKISDGYPGEFGKKRPWEEDSEDNKDRLEEWNAIVDKMIFAMYWKKEWDNPFKKEYFKNKSKILKLHKKELNKLSDEDIQTHNGSYWRSSPRAKREDELCQELSDQYYKNLSEHERLVQEGCELFGKYFRHLWD